jgi:nicotinamide mononucleotide transporter
MKSRMIKNIKITAIFVAIIGGIGILSYAFGLSFFKFMEIIGTLGGIGYTIFTVKQNKLGWIICMLYAPVMGYLSFKKQLYANMILYVYFFIQAARGLVRWNDKTKKTLNPSFADNKYRLEVLGLGVILFLGVHYLLSNWTNASSPFFDTFVICVKIVSLIFQVNKQVEGWVAMSIGNFCAFILYIMSGLPLASLTFIISFVINVTGVITWGKIARAEGKK